MKGIPADLRGRALWVILGCLVCQLGLGLGYVTSPLLTDITADLGLSRTDFSSAGAVRLFVMSAASPLLGWLVLRVGVRPVLIGSTLCVLPAFFWMSRMQTLAELYGVNALLALVMTGFGDVTLGVVVASWVTRGRGLALGLVYTGSNLAGAILTPAVTWLAVRGSWREALLWVGVAATALIAPFAFGVVRERRSGGSAPAPAAPEPSAPSAGRAAGREGEDLDVRAALRTRSFWVLVFAHSAFFFSVLGVLQHLIPSLTDAGVPRGDAAAALSFAIGLGLVSKVAMGALADRLPARLSIQVDYGLLAVSALLLNFVPAQPWLRLFIVAFGFAYAARDVVTPLAIAECFGVRHLATLYGVLMIVLWPAGSAGEIFAAWCFDATGSYALAFRTFAALDLAAFASLFLLRRERASGYAVRP